MKYDKIGDALSAAEAKIGAVKTALADVTDTDTRCRWYLFDVSDDGPARGVFVYVDDDGCFTLEEE